MQVYRDPLLKMQQSWWWLLLGRGTSQCMVDYCFLHISHCICQAAPLTLDPQVQVGDAVVWCSIGSKDKWKWSGNVCTVWFFHDVKWIMKMWSLGGGYFFFLCLFVFPYFFWWVKIPRHALIYKTIDVLICLSRKHWVKSQIPNTSWYFM